MTKDLANKTCKACEGGIPPLTGEQLTPWLKKISDEWEVVDGKKLRREFAFDDFAQTMEFAQKVGAAAEEEQHHPDISISYGKASVEWWTHKIDGLFDNDFIMAAKTDQIFGSM